MKGSHNGDSVFHLGIYLVPAALCLIALFELPYGYYTFLRLVVTVCAGVAGYGCWKNGRIVVAFVFGAVALLFNPVIPVHLARELWAPIDVLVAGTFAIGWYSLRTTTQ